MDVCVRDEREHQFWKIIVYSMYLYTPHSCEWVVNYSCRTFAIFFWIRDKSRKFAKKTPSEEIVLGLYHELVFHWNSENEQLCINDGREFFRS